MTIAGRCYRRARTITPVVLGACVLPVAAVVAIAAVRRTGSPAGWEEKVNAMHAGWMKRGAILALAWMGPAANGAAQTAATPLPAQTATTPSPAPRPTVIGMNPAALGFAASTVPFANLALGSDWLDTHWRTLPDALQDSDGNIHALPADGTAYRFLAIPPTRPEGFEARCTFTGSGTLTVAGPARQIASQAHLLRFRAINLRGKESAPWLVLKDFDPRHPLRDLDCRDVRLDRTVRFRPEFLDTLRGYGVIRFMDWQNANTNVAVPWDRRHTPASNRFDRDGVSVEDMLALVRELDADPWFVMPWNADDDYIARFARMVRAGLPAGRSAYVEVGNEVWNTGFPVGQQAVREGTERKLGVDPREAGMRRYAERTGQVMRLWEAAFPGGNGLVRVLATQHVVPLSAEIALSFRDTAQHVDALATASYFGSILGGTANTRESSLQHLATELPVTLQQAADNRRVAVKYRKRYIGYEGGQGLVLPAQVPLADRLQHDPAMYDLYRQFLAGWQHDIGDVLCLYDSVTRPGAYGSWGLAAWEDETPEEAPKLRAVRDAMRQPHAASPEPHRTAMQPIASEGRGL